LVSAGSSRRASSLTTEKKDDLEFLDELGLEDFQEYEELFKVVGEYKQGKVTRDALKEKLFELRFRKLSDEDLDRIVGETEFTKDGLVSIYNCIIFLKKIIDAGTKEKFQRIKKREGMGLFRVLDKSNYKRKARPYSDKEKNKYAKLINKALKDDADCKNKLPIDPKGDDLYEKLRDGVILSKLVNLCEPNTINEDDIKKNDDMNVYDKYANLEKAIKGAKDIGIQCETNPDDVLDKDKARDNDLLGEIFARLNTKKKDIKENPETPKLAEGGEAPEQIADLPVDDFLKKWFNHHLKEANHPDELKNFEDDVKDSEKYTVLLNQLDPNQCDKSALDETDPVERAKKVIDNAKKLGCETEVTPEDIASGNEAMNRLFTSDLYNAVANNAGGDDYDKDLMKAYIDTINKELCDDTDTKNKVPIDKDNEEVFDKLKDGVIFGKLMNLADKDALDEDTLKTGDELSDDDKNNNLDKVVDGADKLGCPHKASKDDIANGKKKKDQDLLGDILGKIKVTPKLVKEDPDADDLVQDGETKDDLANKVPVDDFLKRWTNKHLKLAESPRVMNNYDDDLKDGEIFTILLNDIAPETCDKSPLDESDPVKRAEKIIENARKLGVDTAVPPEGLANGNPELTKLFLGEIYNAYANPFDANEKECYCKMINKLLGDDPELKDKLPVDPKSNEIFKKMKDGVILAKLINLAAPGTVDERVIVKDPGMKKEDKLNNLNLTINSAKSIGCLIEATPEDVLDEVRTKDVDLLYQILKQIALKKISVQDFPQLLRLKEGKETDEELLTFGPEDFL
jgi:plastin-1